MIRSAIFLLFLSLCTIAPMIQMQFEPLQRLRIHGVSLPKHAPLLTIDALLTGSYQEKAEEWLMKKSGLWTYFVRSDNQLNYEAFGLLSTNYNSQVVLGKNSILFEREYIEALNGKRQASEETLEVLAQDLATLQNALHQRGIGFSLILSASKAELYQDQIPAQFLTPHPPLQSKYEYFTDRLQQHSVSFIDGPKILREIERGKNVRTFAATGTHWSAYGVCNVIQSLLQEVEQQLNKKPKDLICGPLVLRPTPRKADQDLLEIANVWTTESFLQPQYYPKTSVKKEGERYKPSMLFIGTSFVWPMLKVMDRHRLYQRSSFFYYYSRNRKFPSGSYRKIDKATLDWEKDVFSHNMIAIEINESAIENAGSGFIADALIALKASS